MTQALLGVLIAGLLGLAKSLASSLLAGEAKGWLASILMRRVKVAAKKLPQDLAAEQEEEWSAELKALTDRPLRAIRYVLGLNRAARAIAHEPIPRRALSPEPELRIESYLGEDPQRFLAADALDGLTRPFKELLPRHFYDARTAELFDRICELPEYYPARTERSILKDAAGELAMLTGAAELVEIGSGTATKARVLLDALHTAGTLSRYVPVDVTETIVRDCAKDLADAYPGVQVHGLIADLEHHLDRLPPAVGPRIVALLGPTISNLLPGSRRRALRTIAHLLGPDDHLLMGTDLVKDPNVLEAAYDDAEGVTAEFNRNVLRVLNRELQADFDPEDFDYIARFDPQHEWIEMRLRSRRDHTTMVRALDLPVHFLAGEEMRTEISVKFTPERLQGDLLAVGLELVRWLTDPDELFALTLSRHTSLDK
jgi:L-histidine N-alpha-methyltransferase